MENVTITLSVHTLPSCTMYVKNRGWGGPCAVWVQAGEGHSTTLMCFSKSKLEEYKKGKLDVTFEFSR